MKIGKKKGGFSLIELMVVIVIMGILAAVAVPKLFGHMAKAKASELYNSAGAYISMQDAFNTETPDRLGSWEKIGYKMQSSTTFKYLERGTEGGKENAGSEPLSSGISGAWQAFSKGKLNNCEAGSTWQIDIVKGNADDDDENKEEQNSQEYRLVYKVKVTGGAAGTCLMLTPNFGALSTLNRIDAYSES